MLAPLLLLISTSAGEPELIDRIAATINDEVITLSEVEAAAQPFLAHNKTEEKKKALYKDVLDQLIAERLLAQQVKEAKISISEDEVDRAIKDILKQNKITEEELKGALQARGMSMGQYREDLKSQLLRLKIVDMKVRSRVVIPEAEIKTEFERQTKGQQQDELFHIHHIFFRWASDAPAEEKKRIQELANKTRERIVGGEDFAGVAKELSQGPTADKGGDLGEVGASGLIPELKQVLLTTKIGEITLPIDTNNGIHIVRLEGRRMSDKTSYDKMRNAIYQKMYQTEVERQMKLWVEELKKEASIDIRL